MHLPILTNGILIWDAINELPTVQFPLNLSNCYTDVEITNLNLNSLSGGV